MKLREKPSIIYSREKDADLRLYDFAYDWRKDNHITAKYLEAAVAQAKKETKSDRVVIMAHSMGGVVARLYLKEKGNADDVAGVFYRVNTEKSETDNLNSKGMKFEEFEDTVSEIKTIPEVFTFISKIAVIAAGYEIEKIIRDGGCKEAVN